MIHKLNKTTKSVRFIYSKCPHMAKVIDLVGTITYEPYDNPYVFLVDSIIGQMLSNKVADIMSERLRALCKGSITLNKITKLTDSKIKSIGISNSKVKYIRELTDKVKNKIIDLELIENYLMKMQ